MLHCAILDSAGLWLRLIVMTCIIVAEFCRYAASPPGRVPRTPRHVVVASRSPRASTRVCSILRNTFSSSNASDYQPCDDCRGCRVHGVVQVARVLLDESILGSEEGAQTNQR